MRKGEREGERERERERQRDRETERKRGESGERGERGETGRESGEVKVRASGKGEGAEGASSGRVCVCVSRATSGRCACLELLEP